MSEPLPAPAGRPRWRMPGYVKNLLFLLCGLIIGSLVTAVYLRNAAQRAIADPALLSERAVQRLERQLDLDEAQRAAIRQAFRDRLAGFRAIRERVRPEIQAELDALRADVETHLRPDQREQWRARFDAIRQRWQRED
ncbi:MAG: hypothetical protein KF886_18575 [Candidatus Hydrogenedentes bacterium]|nr:hypothetical protein [Candidatus Hydrogenedentota bacterium]